MKLNIIDIKKQIIGKLIIHTLLLTRNFNEILIHQTITTYLSNMRESNSTQKNRGDVKHSTKKPWRQKGTGRARAGMISSPLWRGGGVSFPNNSKENYKKKMNQKMYKMSISVILSQLSRNNKLIIVDDLSLNTRKTKMFKQLIGLLQLKKLLFIVTKINANLKYSYRNMINILILEVKKINPYHLIYFNNIVVTTSSIIQLEEKFG